MDAAQCGGDVLRGVAIDFADEAQGQVELVVGLPARAGDTTHGGEQHVAHRHRQFERDEQAVHHFGTPIISALAPPRPSAGCA